MAKFETFHNFRLDLLNPDGMIAIDDTVVDIPPVTPTRIPIQLNDGGLLSIEGNGFSIFFEEEGQEWATGTVDLIRYSENGLTLFKWSDLDISLDEIMRLVAFENDIDPIEVEERLVSGDDVFITSGGHDVLYGGAGNDLFDGGDGIDTVLYRTSRGERDVNVDFDGSITISGGAETDLLVNIERIQFSDGTLSFDVDGIAGQAYRLYQAAFDRSPDVDGLGYWIKELDASKGDLAWMANNFILSEEFKATYGSPETVSDQQFLNLLYQNVLNRDADGEGFTYWMNELANGFARERVLASFSESVENQENVAAAIQDGIWYV